MAWPWRTAMLKSVLVLLGMQRVHPDPDTWGRLHTREKFGLEIGRAFEINCEIILRCIARKYSPDTPTHHRSDAAWSYDVSGTGRPALDVVKGAASRFAVRESILACASTSCTCIHTMNAHMHACTHAIVHSSESFVPSRWFFGRTKVDGGNV